MLKNIIAWSATNRALVFLAVSVLAVAGIWAAYTTPVDAIPDLSDVQVIIRTEWSGQGPQIVEEQVTYPLSTAMLAVPHAKAVRGYSMFGSSFVYVLFDDQTDMYWARSRVLEYLNLVSEQLPRGVNPTLGPDATGVGWVFQYSLTDSTGAHDLAQLRSIQDFFLKFELQSVEGVAEVATLGGFQRQYQVIVDPQRLAAYGIPVREVMGAIERSNRDVGGRIIELGEREFMVRGRGYLRGVEDIRAVPVKQVGSTAVTVGDIAVVQIGPEIRRGIAEKDGLGEVVGGIVIMRYGESAKAVIERVKERLASLEDGLPPGVRVETEYDRSALIDRGVSTLRTRIWEELLVVALIVMLFLLHVRSALVAIISVPVGILAALLIMRTLGINANIMSLGGIAIAIGVMVDAALVMVENAHKHLERENLIDGTADPHARIRAVVRAAQEVGPSLFFSLLIVTVSFLPVFALGEVEGRLFRPLALTKTFAMASASILAITLVPALMVVFIKGRIRTEANNPVSRIFIHAYRPVIKWTLRNPVAVIAVSVLLLVLSVLPVQRLTLGTTLIPFPQIGSEFMPPFNEGDLLYMPTTLPGVSPQKAKELLQQTDRIIKRFPEVASVFGKAGRAETATDPAPLSMFETVIVLKPESEWRPGVTRESLIAELNGAIQIPGLTNAWTMPIRARTDMLATGIRTPVGIKVSGPDLAALASLGEQIEDVVGEIAGVRSVYAERVMGGSYLDIDVRRAEAARYGLTTGDVLEVVSSSVGGRNVTTTVEGLERYPVNVRYARDLRQSLPALQSVLVPTAGGAYVPLGQVADLSLVEGPPMIKSENARPNAWIFVDLEEAVDLGSFVADARVAVANQVTLPSDYALKWSGQYEYLERANQRLALLVPLTVAIILLLLTLHLGSMAEASMLLFSLPFALIGAVWLMSILGYNWSLAVGVGMIAMAGLAAETAVVMQVYLDEAVSRFRAEGRMLSLTNLRAALEEGAVDRVRPKLMTVLTTIIGLLPVMIGAGTGSEIMRRIAAPMVGGLVSSTILTLVVIPALYVLYYRRKEGVTPG